MYVQQPLIFCLITIAACIQLADCSGHLKIKLVRFSNPKGKGSNGHCCDGRGWFCEPYGGCDHKFEICVDKYPRGSLSRESCSIGRVTTGVFQNSRTINFGTDIKGPRNPLIFRFKSWTGGARIKVRIVDEDGLTKDDHVDDLQADYQVAPRSEGVYVTKNLRSSRTSLNLQVQAYCDENYYGRDCATFCYLTALERAEMGCSCNQDTGRKVCPPAMAMAMAMDEPNSEKETTTQEATQKLTTTALKITTPKITTPKITTKQTTQEIKTTKVTTHKITTPKITTPPTTTEKITTNKITTPKITEAKTRKPKITTQKVTTPKPTTMKITTQKITTPKPTTMILTTPEATTTKITMMTLTTTKATVVNMATPETTTVKIISTKVTTPALSTTKPTTLKMAPEDATERSVLGTGCPDWFLGYLCSRRKESIGANYDCSRINPITCT